MKLDSNNHSVFLMYDHLVLVIKYRRKVINDIISDYVKEKFVSLGETYNITLVEWNHDQDHVIFSSKLILTVSYQHLSTHTKVQVQHLSKRIFLTFIKNDGKKCFGQEVSVC